MSVGMKSPLPVITIALSVDISNAHPPLMHHITILVVRRAGRKASHGRRRWLWNSVISQITIIVDCTKFAVKTLHCVLVGIGDENLLLILLNIDPVDDAAVVLIEVVTNMLKSLIPRSGLIVRRLGLLSNETLAEPAPEVMMVLLSDARSPTTVLALGCISRNTMLVRQMHDEGIFMAGQMATAFGSAVG